MRCRLTTELELLYQRSIMDGGALETEYRTRCLNYEAAIKQMRQELAAARAEALKLSKMATDDRKKCIGLQAEVQRGAASYSELCTSAENARLVALREREDLEAQVARLTNLNIKLEERASHAEGEAARAIVAHRDDKMKWDQERRQMAVHVVARVHHRRRLDRMRSGLLRWRQIAEFERLRTDFAAQHVELRTTLQVEHDEGMLRLRTALEEKLRCEANARQRAESSRDRLAEERPALTLAARGYGPMSVLQQWRVQMLRAREKRAVDQAAGLSQRITDLEAEMQRVRESFARMCVFSFIPRIHRQAMRQLFNRWAVTVRLLGKKDQDAELDEAWQAAEKMGANVKRIRRAACNLVFVSLELLASFIITSSYFTFCDLLRMCALETSWGEHSTAGAFNWKKASCPALNASLSCGECHISRTTTAPRQMRRKMPRRDTRRNKNIDIVEN